MEFIRLQQIQRLPTAPLVLDSLSVLKAYSRDSHYNASLACIPNLASGL